MAYLIRMPPEPDFNRGASTDGYSQRLRKAMDNGPRPLSVRKLAGLLQESYPGLRGVSYGGVRQYVEGRVENPRVELLRAIARTLNVREAWLLYEDGAMTEGEDAAERIAEEQAERAIDDYVVGPNPEVAEKVFLQEWPYYIDMEVAAHYSLWRLWSKLVERERASGKLSEPPTRGEDEDDIGAACARKISRALRLSLEAVDLQGPQPGQYTGMRARDFLDIENPTDEQVQQYRESEDDQPYLATLSDYVISFSQGMIAVARGQQGSMTQKRMREESQARRAKIDVMQREIDARRAEDKEKYPHGYPGTREWWAHRTGHETGCPMCGGKPKARRFLCEKQECRRRLAEIWREYEDGLEGNDDEA